MPERGPNADDAARAEQWETDRTTEAQPLPYADQTHYKNPVEQGVDLAAAERSNVARAAGELGLTSPEWEAMRKDLGRSPRAEDLK